MDLTTQYLGLTLRNPVVASAGPLSQTVAGVRELLDDACAVMPALGAFDDRTFIDVMNKIRALKQFH